MIIIWATQASRIWAGTIPTWVMHHFTTTRAYATRFTFNQVVTFTLLASLEWRVVGVMLCGWPSFSSHITDASSHILKLLID